MTAAAVRTVMDTIIATISAAPVVAFGDLPSQFVENMAVSMDSFGSARGFDVEYVGINNTSTTSRTDAAPYVERSARFVVHVWYHNSNAKLSEISCVIAQDACTLMDVIPRALAALSGGHGGVQCDTTGDTVIIREASQDGGGNVWHMVLSFGVGGLFEAAQLLP